MATDMTLNDIWNVIFTVLMVSAQLPFILGVLRGDDISGGIACWFGVFGFILPALLCIGFYPKLLDFYHGYLKAFFIHDKADIIFFTAHVGTILTMPFLFVSPGGIGFTLYVLGKKAYFRVKRLA